MGVRLNKDPVSAWTHIAGTVAAVVGLVALVLASRHDGLKVTGLSVYGASLVALFLASSLYHFFDVGERGNRWLRTLDHVAIFVFIAGSYVPPLLCTLTGAWRVSMLAVVGGLALAGVVLKLAWLDCPAWLSTLVYVAFGWIAVVPAPLIVPQLPAWPLAWLLSGGLLYTVGAAVFHLEWPDPWPRKVGHHEVWHVLVLAGAACHFVFMWWLVDGVA